MPQSRGAILVRAKPTFRRQRLRGVGAFTVQLARSPVLPGPNIFVSLPPVQRGLTGLWAWLSDTGPLFEAPEEVSGQSALTPDWWYNLQGQASPDQIVAATTAANQEAQAATINPITGQPVPQAVAYATQTAGAVPAILQQGQATATPTSTLPNWVIDLLLVVGIGLGVYVVVKIL